MSSRIKFAVVTASTLLTVLLLIGTVLGKSTAPEEAYKHIGVFTDVVSRIKSEYVEEPDMKSVTLGALNGLLESIDPFASYLSPEQYKDYLKNKESNKADVGLILSRKFGYVGVVGVAPGSPAAKAGLATGDMIESIKGIATRDMPLAYASLLLQGEAGSTIELSVVRVRRPEPTKIKLTRAPAALPAVEANLMAGQVGYLRPYAISNGRVKEIAAAIDRIQKQGAQKLVLDLRGCSLGTPDDGVALANLFLNQGRITYLQGQRVQRQNIEADPAKAVTTLPLAVLTNRGTAGGAEVAAAALAENKRGQTVGEKTYGDAAQRRAITMEDGGAIILSVAKYYTPSGKSIQDNGVTPDNAVAEPEAQVDLDENGDPLPEAPEQPQPQRKLEDDPLYKKAIEVLGVKA